jgi:hypothetical protein
MHLALPISFTELMSYRSFFCADGRIVRAGLAMLHAAWNAEAPGRLPPGIEALAQITSLSVEEVQHHYELLTNGWELRDGALCNATLESLAARMTERFGPELEVLRASWAAAGQPHDTAVVFNLVPDQAVEKAKARGKHMLPKDFVPNAASHSHVVEAGYDCDEMRAWLMRRFFDFASSSGRMQRDWQAMFRNFSTSEITLRQFREQHGYRLGRRPSIELTPGTAKSPFDRLRQVAGRQQMPTFAEITSTKNSHAMAAALARGLDISADQQQSPSPAYGGGQ